MAMIKCPECGKEISDRAPTCVNCGCPIAGPAAASQVDRTQEIERYLELAVRAIQGENSEQVEKACEAVLAIDPKNSRAWELEARGILFQSSLRDNKIMQAIGAAANAVSCAEPERREELADSLYDAIVVHINGLLNIAVYKMPTMYTVQYATQCMNYYGALLSGIPNMSKRKIEAELRSIATMDADSKKAIMPRKRAIYAARVTKPSWDEQFRALMRQKGML